MYSIRFKSVCIWLMVLTGFLAACSPKTTPPGASSVGGGVGETRYSYHHWQEGLAILVWHDIVQGAEGCTGSGSTEDPVFRLECDVTGADGQHFSWEAHTTDGVTAQMWIDGQEYMLDEGALFLVSSAGGEIQVVQLQRDLSEIQPDNEGVEAWAENDSAIVEFVAGAERP